MLISESTREGMEWSAVVVGIAAGLVFLSAWDHNRRRRMGAAVVAILIAGAFGLWVHYGKHDVLICTEADGVIHARRLVSLTGSGVGGTTIINRTAATLQLERRFYSTTPDPWGVASTPTMIPPGTRLVIYDLVQHLGPNDAPPDKIESDTSLDSRYWLTWPLPTWQTR